MSEVLLHMADIGPAAQQMHGYQLSMFERRAIEDEKWERLRGVVGKLTPEALRNVFKMSDNVAGTADEEPQADDDLGL